jgi:hypothetical protein
MEKPWPADGLLLPDPGGGPVAAASTGAGSGRLRIGGGVEGTALSVPLKFGYVNVYANVS